jgi:hypothetical protein
MWGLGGAYPTTRRFEEQYHCYSVAYADKAHLEVRFFDRNRAIKCDISLLYFISLFYYHYFYTK